MGRTACTEPQCLYKDALYLCLFTLPHNICYDCDVRKERKRLRKNIVIYFILYETVKQLRVESVIQIFVCCLPFITNHLINAGSYVGVLNTVSCGTVVSYK